MKFHLSIYLGFLAIFLSACAGVSNLASSKEVLVNESLPQVRDIKTISDTSNVAFEWSPLYDENIKGFYLYRSKDGAEFKQVAKIEDKFQTHFVDTKLDPSTKYLYKMKSYNEQNHISLESNVVEVITQPRPEALSFVQVITNLPNKTKLIWRPHTDLRIDSYIIERKKDDDDKFSKIKTIKNRLSAEYIDDDLKPNVRFTYRVIAKTFDGIESEPSQAYSSTTKALPPEITQLSASEDLAGKISLKWAKSDYEDFSYYKIYASSSSFLPFTLIAKSESNEYEDIINKPGVKKSYKVTIVDKDGLESPMPKQGVSGQTLDIPNAPSIILAQSTETGIILEWSDNDNRAVEYIVKRYGGEANAEFRGIKEKRLQDNKALPGVEYSYEVISIDELGSQSEPSKRVKAAQ